MTLKNLFGDVALDASVKELSSIVTNVLEKLNLNSLPTGASTSSLQTDIINLLSTNLAAIKTSTDAISSTINSENTEIQNVLSSLLSPLGKDSSLVSIYNMIALVEDSLNSLITISGTLGTNSKLSEILTELSAVLSKLNQNSLPAGATTETTLSGISTKVSSVAQDTTLSSASLKLDSIAQDATLSSASLKLDSIAKEATLSAASLKLDSVAQEETLSAASLKLDSVAQEETLTAASLKLDSIAQDATLSSANLKLGSIESIANAINSKVAFTATVVPQIEYDSAGKITYLGHALPGSATASPVWRIQKFNYDGSGRMTSIQYANGQDTFINIWNDRASLTYS